MRDPDKLLDALYSKKPRVKHLMDHYMSMSNDEIMAQDQPLWIRERLVKRKHFGMSKANAEAIADAMTAATPASVDTTDFDWEVRIWDSNPYMLGIEGRMQVEANPGDILLLFPDTHQVRLNQVLVQLDHFTWYGMMMGSHTDGWLTESEHYAAVQAMLSKR